MFDARLPARLPPEKAEPARFDAWLNLSQREKASVFMTVRMSAMAWHVSTYPPKAPHKSSKTKSGTGG